MNDLARVFTYDTNPVRTVLVDDEPWFVAADVCAVLEIGRTHDAVRGLDDDEKGTETIRTLGGGQVMTVINESGLYSLILRSRKPSAKAFKRWVTHDVLPAIRKTGSYSTTPAIPQTYAEALQLAANQAKQLEEKTAQLAIAAPKAESWDVLASGAGDYSVGDAAKILSRDPGITLGRDRLFAHLSEQGWVFRSRADGRWRAYQAAVDSGRLSELPQTYPTADGGTAIAPPQVRITPKGLHKLHQQLGGTKPLQLPLPV